MKKSKALATYESISKYRHMSSIEFVEKELGVKLLPYPAELTTRRLRRNKLESSILCALYHRRGIYLGLLRFYV
jgi:hypothetical protein